MSTTPNPESWYCQLTPQIDAKFGIVLPSPSVCVPWEWLGIHVPVAQPEAGEGFGR